MANEMRGFVFATSFLIIFAGMIAAMPTDLQGSGATPDIATPIDPSLVADFSEYDAFNTTSFSPIAGGYVYEYSLGGRTWLCDKYGSEFFVGAKVYVGGVLWLGQLDSCEFISPTGENHGGYLSFTDIDADATNGSVRYSMRYIINGNSAGDFLVYWNETTYSGSSDAWTGSELYFLHGVGIADTAAADVGSLLLSLLFMQLPDVPALVNLLIITPIWACIAYIIWYVIKETIPFV